MSDSVESPREEQTAGPEQSALRLMSFDERYDWFCKNSRIIPRTGMRIIKVDRHLAAYGYDDEIDGIIERFGKYIDGPDQAERKGAMG